MPPLNNLRLAIHKELALIALDIETCSQCNPFIMRLNEIKKGGLFRVKNLDCCNDCVSRLMSMGLLPDQEIRLVHEAPLGDPIAVEFNDCHISVRLEDAAHVEVEPISK